MATDISTMTAEEIAFLVKIGQIDQPTNTPKKETKAEEN